MLYTCFALQINLILIFVQKQITKLSIRNSYFMTSINESIIKHIHYSTIMNEIQLFNSIFMNDLLTIFVKKSVQIYSYSGGKIFMYFCVQHKS